MNSIAKKVRRYLSKELIINTWEDAQSFYDELLNRTISSEEELLKWIADRSETDAVVDEEYRWRYIKQSCNTEDEVHKRVYENFIEHIMPKWMSATNLLNKKLADCEYSKDLDQERFFVYLRHLKTQLQLFREENISLAQQTQLLSNEYATTIGAMTIEHEGKEYTLPQTSIFLQNQDSRLRKEIYEKVNIRRLQDRDKLNDLFSKLLKIRHQMALNAGYENYRDYMFAELGRFDYAVKDCEQFHEAIKTEVIPLVNKIYQKRKQQLQAAQLFPYDLEVDPQNHPALHPFKTEEEFIEKTIKCLHKVDPMFAQSISIMNEMQHLDLNSRKGKAPGGYNMTLPETGVPFVFMNAAGTQRDLETIVHEAGHAVHSFLMRDLPYNFDMEISSEMAELASMSMEFLSIEGWDVFYSDEDKKRAVESHLVGTITMLPWIALIDKFQHWIYTNPEHTNEARENKWEELHKELSSEIIDWTPYSDFRKTMWHKQLHIFEIPFYYIEYGIAQLGAIAVWRNFKNNKEQALEAYKNALQLGYTKPIPEMYKSAGIQFDFSKEYVKELMTFLETELD